jgi:hypothetical protein
MLPGYYMEDTKVNKRFMVQLNMWWLTVKNSERDENAILSANFVKTRNG